MLSNLLEITVDPLLGDHQKKQRPEQVPGSPKYEMIYSDYQNINMRRSYNRNNLYPIESLNQLQSRKEKEKIMTSRIHQFNFQQAKKFEKKKDAPSANVYPNNPGSNYNTANPGEETKPSLKIKVLATRSLPMHTSPKTEKIDDHHKLKGVGEQLKMV